MLAVVLERDPRAPRPALGRHAVDQAGVPLVRQVVRLRRELQPRRQVAGLDDVVVGRVVAAAVTVELEVVKQPNLATRRFLGVVVEVERGRARNEDDGQQDEQRRSPDEPHLTPLRSGTARGPDCA